MREIEFRAKNTNDQWRYGYLERQDLLYDEIYDCSSSIQIETLGQYTGRTDKNGIKIFEGDILQSPYYLCDCDKCVCVYQETDTGIGFELVTTKRYNLGDYSCILSDEWEDFRVVGNIHDNPELLEVSDD